ncbi:MAG: hypothetical protein CME10_03320 [Gemmatimonadetes bacterium]|nr:hypothetical protein [Gemmatimonadota bacterium]
MPNSGARILIVGAGIIGRALAYYLSKAGAKVVLIDAGGGMSCASRASLGVLTHYSGGFSGYGLFIRDSLAMHESLSCELFEATGMDVGWSRLGGVDLAFDENDEEKINTLYKEGRSYGIALQRLAPEDIINLEACISRDVRGGLYFLDDQRVDPLKLAQALLTAAVDAGTVVHWGESLLEVEYCAFHDISVKTSCARRSSDILILASGAWTRGLAEQLGVRINVRPVGGQYACFSGVSPRVVLRHKGFQLTPDDLGVRVGATTEDVGFFPQSTYRGESNLASFYQRALTSSASGRSIARGVGLRSKPKKGRPMIGPLRDYESVFVATGHYKNGVLMAPLTAKVLTDWILCGDPKRDMGPFFPER